MDSRGRKRKCGTFSSEDQIRLLTLIEREKEVIENKTTNKVANEEKDAAWRRITESFNAGAVQYRNVEQLRTKFDNLKTKARKVVAECQHNFKGTGGAYDAVIEAVLKVINVKTVVGLTNLVDCDSDDVPVIVICEDKDKNYEIIQTEDIDDSTLLEASDFQITEPITSNLQESVDMLGGTDIKAPCHSGKVATKNKWTSYTPNKLRQPVNKKLRPTVTNPAVLAKEEYYKQKKEDLQEEVWARREQNRRLEEEHEKRQRLLDLEIQMKEAGQRLLDLEIQMKEAELKKIIQANKLL